MMNILVTGSSGYIGTVLVKKLMDAGFTVTGCDIDIFEPERSWGKQFYDDYQKAKHIKKDTRSLTEKDLAGIDGIVDLAAVSNDPAGELDQNLTKQINYEAPVRLAKLAKKAGVSRFVFSSSCSVYGGAGESYIDEQSPVSPLTAYAHAKVTAEKELLELADRNFTVVCPRNATVYGASPRMRMDLVVNNMSGFAFTSKAVKVLSDGTSWRPNIHVEDVAGAFVAFLQADADKVNGQRFNVGSEQENYRVIEIANIISKAFGVPVQFAENRVKDNRSYRVNFSKINNTVKEFKPKWTIDSGARDLRKLFEEMKFDEAAFKKSRYYTIESWKQFLAQNKAVAN